MDIDRGPSVITAVVPPAPKPITSPNALPPHPPAVWRRRWWPWGAESPAEGNGGWASTPKRLTLGWWSRRMSLFSNWIYGASPRPAVPTTTRRRYAEMLWMRWNVRKWGNQGFRNHELQRRKAFFQLRDFSLMVNLLSLRFLKGQNKNPWRRSSLCRRWISNQIVLL